VMDLVENAPAANFSIKYWRLTECGSLRPACTEDIVPMAPFEALCRGALNQSGNTCDWHRLPQDSHLTCHRDYGWQCRVWFEGLYPRASPTSTLMPATTHIPTSSLPSSSSALPAITTATVSDAQPSRNFVALPPSFVAAISIGVALAVAGAICLYVFRERVQRVCWRRRDDDKERLGPYARRM
jgi:hypothetical protein